MYYFVNKSARDNGDHEVHVVGCTHMPEGDDRVYLGDFRYCHPALAVAKRMYDRVNGCSFCCLACNTRSDIPYQREPR